MQNLNPNVLFGVEFQNKSFAMDTEIKIFESTNQLSEEIANILKHIKFQSRGKPVHVALSGGSTPKAIFKYLTQQYGASLISGQFHFWWGDDRCVPPTHDDSNFKWAKALWLSPVSVLPKNIHRIKGENDPEAEALRYAEEINQYVVKENGLPSFDFVLLGMGDDGHTASIFPDQMQLLSSDKLCEVATQPETGQKRVTFTGTLINNSKMVAFISTGEVKAQKVYEVVKMKNSNLPATHIQPDNGKLIWLLDKAAASRVSDQ
jgi:6-phosphogluconolactonase